MAKVGISISIDVSKLDKSRFYQGKKGVYADLTTFVDLDNLDKYDNNGFIKQSSKKDEQVDLPILGNVKLFWRDDGQQSQPSQAAPAQGQGSEPSTGFDNFDDDIPF